MLMSQLNASEDDQRSWKENFMRAVSTQAAGNMVVQLIGFLGLPIIARLYAPEAFGTYGVVLAMSSFLSIGFFLGMDFGILAAKPRHRRTLFTLLVALCFGASCLGALLCVMLYGLDPLTTGAAALAILLQNWAIIAMQLAIALDRHRLLSVMRIVQAVGFLVLSLAFAWLKPSAATLLLAAALSALPPVVLLSDRRQFGRLSRARICVAFRLRWDFFWPSWPGRFVNLFGARAPIMMAPLLFGEAGAGILAMAFRLLEVPSRTVSGAVSSVLVTRMAAREGATLPIITSLLWPLMAGSALIFGLGYVILPYAIPLLLGPEWTAVTEVSQGLLVAVGIQFAISPLSGVILLNRHGSWGFFWQLAFALSMAALLAVSWQLEMPLDALTWAISGIFLVMYTLYGVVILLSCRVADVGRTTPTSLG